MGDFFLGLLGMLVEVAGELFLELAWKSILSLLRSKEP
jgi:hypothetical protein